MKETNFLEQQLNVSPSEEQKQGDNLDEKYVKKDFPSKDEYIELMREEGLEKYAEAYEQVCELCEKIKQEGGEALLVGGSVRDFYMGKIPKDFDLEVYRLAPEKVRTIAETFGEKCKEAGRGFGVLKIFLGNGIDIDLSLPRYESRNKDGKGRKFDVNVDTDMSYKEAARRRDFTMNTLAANPLSSEVHNYYGGIEDIENRVLRVTDEEKFKEDSLRIMRAMQFVGRFGMKIDQKSEEIIKSIISELHDISKERFLEEWHKLLLKSDKPSLGLMKGMELGVFDEMYPEFPPLATTPQEKAWHPEGDVWMHTLMSTDEATKIVRAEKLEDDEALNIMLATLCHDLGKPATTEIGEKIISPGHDQAGEKPTAKFLKTIGLADKESKKVIKLVTNHMAPSMLYIASRKGKVGDKAIRKLAKKIYPAIIPDLVRVAQADHAGRGPFTDINLQKDTLDSYSYHPKEWLLKKSKELGVYDKKPDDLVMGRDLIKQNKEGGQKMGKVIDLLNEIRDVEDELRELINEGNLEKLSKEEALTLVAGDNNLDNIIELLSSLKAKIKTQLKSKKLLNY